MSSGSALFILRVHLTSCVHLTSSGNAQSAQKESSFFADIYFVGECLRADSFCLLSISLAKVVRIFYNVRTCGGGYE